MSLKQSQCVALSLIFCGAENLLLKREAERRKITAHKRLTLGGSCRAYARLRERAVQQNLSKLKVTQAPSVTASRATFLSEEGLCKISLCHTRAVRQKTINVPVGEDIAPVLF